MPNFLDALSTFFPRLGSDGKVSSAQLPSSGGSGGSPTSVWLSTSLLVSPLAFDSGYSAVIPFSTAIVDHDPSTTAASVDTATWGWTAPDDALVIKQAGWYIVRMHINAVSVTTASTIADIGANNPQSGTYSPFEVPPNPGFGSIFYGGLAGAGGNDEATLLVTDAAVPFSLGFYAGTYTNDSSPAGTGTLGDLEVMVTQIAKLA